MAKKAKQTHSVTPVTGGSSPLFLALIQRGGAGAGVHGDRRLRRLRTRSAQNRAAIRDH